jgi:hypothetical protein
MTLQRSLGHDRVDVRHLLPSLRVNELVKLTRTVLDGSFVDAPASLDERLLEAPA